ncbi:hypothetical protein BH23PLA1_BH23PLA1_22750 [soil metagenome]
MQILVNTDNHVEGSDDLTRLVEIEVEGTLGRFSEQITRVEVHLNDQNSHKAGDNDKRCQIEARLSGLRPISVTHLAGTIEEAISGAVDKMETTLDRTVGKLGHTKGRTSFGGDQVI